MTPGNPPVWNDERHGPLPAVLLVLTMVTGLVDAVSFLALGHVFVANMTGNVVFLGFAAAGARDLSLTASLAAIVAFMIGALAGGRLGARFGSHRGRFLAIVTYLKIALVASALGVSLAGLDPVGAAARYVLIVPLALAMGLQNAAARRLRVPDLTTTVLTLTLTGLAADSAMAGGSAPNPRRRLLATVIMFVGAVVGALLVLKISVAAALGVVLALLAANGIVMHRFSTSLAKWTAET